MTSAVNVAGERIAPNGTNLEAKLEESSLVLTDFQSQVLTI